MSSIIRELEYSHLKRLSLSGKVLDLGGSTKSGYHKFLGKQVAVTTVNIDPEYGCDIVSDIQEPFPFPDVSFDHVLCFNVLEHVYGFTNVFKETARVLKPGGLFVFATPFMFHIHGSPQDFFRYTEVALTRILEEQGFCVDSISALGSGFCSLTFQTVFRGLPSWINIPLKCACVFLDHIGNAMSARYRQLTKTIPLGYFVVARRERGAS